MGAVAATARVQFGLLLRLRDPDGAAAVLQDISDPTSSHYGQWLTRAQFNRDFGPSTTVVANVRSWLRQQGFELGRTLPSGMYVQASGTAAQVMHTFGSTLETFRYHGRVVRTNIGPLSFPGTAGPAVTTAVVGILGIDQGRALKKPADVLPGPPAGYRIGSPCSAYFGQKLATDQPTAYGRHQPYATCGYVPSQLQSVYGETQLIAAGLNGRGYTVAITDAFASPTMLGDAHTYSIRHGQPAFRAGQYTELRPDTYNVADPVDAQNWYNEETLDVEAVHAMAPGAKVVFASGADDFTGLDTAWAAAIDDHAADIVTNSWSFSTDDVSSLGADQVAFYDQFSLEAALTGITVTFASGDEGDGTAGGSAPADRTVSFPTDEPYVTSVGGTSLEVGSRGQRVAEYGWSNSYSALVGGSWSPALPGTYGSGGGGGTSTLFSQPSYQRGRVPPSLSLANGAIPMRVVPDISMVGDPNTGLDVGETQEFPEGTHYDEYRIGGTSVSSPLLAGMIAVADQLSRRSLGFVNPALYRMLRTPALDDITAPTRAVAQVRVDLVNDVDTSDGLSYLLQTIDSGSSTLRDTSGYDNETGVGSPGGPLFFAGLAIWGHAGR